MLPQRANSHVKASRCFLINLRCKSAVQEGVVKQESLPRAFSMFAGKSVLTHDIRIAGHADRAAERLNDWDGVMKTDVGAAEFAQLDFQAHVQCLRGPLKWRVVPDLPSLGLLLERWLTC